MTAFQSSPDLFTKAREWNEFSLVKWGIDQEIHSSNSSNSSIKRSTHFIHFTGVTEWPIQKIWRGFLKKFKHQGNQGTSRHHWHLSQYWHSQDASGGHMAYHSAQPCLALNNWSLCKSKLRLNTYPSKLHFVLLQSCFWVFIRPSLAIARFGSNKTSVCSMSEPEDEEIKEKKFETRNSERPVLEAEIRSRGEAEWSKPSFRVQTLRSLLIILSPCINLFEWKLGQVSILI